MSSKVVVLGIDGASFDLLGPWVKQDMLPNVRRLLAEGAHGILHSTIPPYSAQAWVSMMTGRGPAKHGVVDFFEPVDGRGHRGFVSSSMIKSETIWETLGRHGKRVGVVNVPLTYPPMPVSGYMVSGFMTPKGHDDYTYPLELREEILSIAGEYDPDPWDLLEPRQSLASFVHWMHVTEQVARHLQSTHPVDVYFNVIQALDQLQHLFWDALTDQTVRARPEFTRLWPSIQRCYQAADETVGHRLSLLDGDTTLFLVSDHGFQPVTSSFNVNRWLHERGFLTYASGQASSGRAALHRLGLTREGIKTLVRRVDALGLRRLVGRFARATIADKLDDTLAMPIDWSRTVAYSGTRTSEGIHINLRGRQPRGIVRPGDEYERLRCRIMDDLMLASPDTGQSLVSAVYLREDVHRGDYLEQIPDVLFSLDGRPYLTSNSTVARHVVEPLAKGDVRGRHHSHGIFAAVGPDIVPGLFLEGANIVDVAPTILYTLGLPIPADMDGKVLQGVFRAEYRDTHPAQREGPRGGTATTGRQESEYTEEEDADMQRRLQGLGYLS